MRGGSVVAGAGTSPGAHARGARAGRGGRSAGPRGGPGSGRVGRGRGPRARVGGAVGLRRPGSPGAGLGPRRWRVAGRARGRGGGSLGGGAAAQGRAGPSVAPGGAPAGRRVAARLPGASHRGTGELQRRQTQGGARAARRGGRAAPLRGLRGRGGGGGGGGGGGLPGQTVLRIKLQVRSRSVETEVGRRGGGAAGGAWYAVRAVPTLGGVPLDVLPFAGAALAAVFCGLALAKVSARGAAEGFRGG